MAAVDFSSILSRPATVLIGASVGESWKEVIVPTWATSITIHASHSLWLAVPTGLAGATDPADGAATSDTAHKVGIDVTGTSAAYALSWRDAEDRPAMVGVSSARSLFVAAQSGTADVRAVFGVGR